MAITDIESNDLQRMTNGIYDESYSSFLGIGEGRRKAKKQAGQIATVEQPNAAFKDKIFKVYSTIRENEAATNTAKSNLNKEGGVENVFVAVKDFGTPTTKKNILDHNAAVAAYIKYNYANLPNADCDTLMKVIGSIDADVEAANKAQSAGQGNPTSVAAYGKIQAKVKKLLIEQDCEKKQEQLEQEKAKEETLGSLTSATKITDKKDNTLKYVSFGIGGVVVLISLVMLFRKS